MEDSVLKFALKGEGAPSKCERIQIMWVRLCHCECSLCI